MTRSSYGPERTAPAGDGSASDLRNAVAHGCAAQPTTRGCADGSDARPALDLLVDLGLLRDDRDARPALPVDPAAIQSQVVVPLAPAGRRAAHRVGPLGGRLQRARAGLPDLAAGARSARSPRSTASTTSTASSTPRSTTRRSELLTAQPHGRRPATTLAEAEDRDVKALRAGRRDAHALPALRPAQPGHPRVRRRHRRPRRRGAHPRRVLQAG